MNNLPDPFNQLPTQAFTKLELKKQETLFHQGESVSGMFYLESGEVTLSRYGLAGEETIIHLAQQQETFAEAALFSDVFHCNAVATENTQIIKINNRLVLKHAEEHPEFSMKLMARFASQIQILRSQKELVSIRSAQERVYVALGQGLLKDSIKKFSAIIALSHEATYRALAKLVSDKRIIKVGRGHYSLPNK
jgi:CRP-like cAMP-binding protein